MEINIRLIDPTPEEEWRVLVTADGKDLLVLGFKRLALMSDLVYVTMTPIADLTRPTPSMLKEFRRLFNQISGWKLFCQVPVEDKRAAHWAEFFGFRRVDPGPPGRFQYEKDTR